MTLVMNQSRVETWLTENEDFTNNFIFDWVRKHPELHLALFKCNPCFTLPKPPSLPCEFLDTTNSKDSGVDIEQIQLGTENLTLSDSNSSAESVRSVASSSNLANEAEVEREAYEQKLAASVLKKDLWTYRLETMLDMATFSLESLFAPEEIFTNVMCRAQLLFHCTVVNLLVSDLVPFDNEYDSQHPLGDTANFSRAYRLDEKNEVRRVPHPEQIPGLMSVIKSSLEKGTTFELGENTMCICLRGTNGVVIGFIVLRHTEVELNELLLSGVDFRFVEFFSLVCGLAIDSSLSVTVLTNQTSQLLDAYTKSLKQQGCWTCTSSSSEESFNTTYSDESSVLSSKSEPLITSQLQDTTPSKGDHDVGSLSSSKSEGELQTRRVFTTYTIENLQENI